MEKLSLVLVFCYVVITATMVHCTFEESNEVNQWIQKLGNTKKKVTKLHFYLHDTVSGPNPSAITVVHSPLKNSPTLFGVVNIMDDLLTVAPRPTSNQVGRAQGLYASSGLEDVSLLMSMNLVFTSGKFNGSSIAVIGRNMVFHSSRELPIVGGTGVFRLASGFVTLKPHVFNVTSGNAIVEYNVVVFHY